MVISTMKVLAVGAQPGEIEARCGGTLASFARRGDRIALACICNGNLGHGTISPDDLADIREHESQNAAAILGAELHWLNHSDFTVEVDPVTTMKLAEIVRGFQPDLVLTHSPVDRLVDHANTHALVLRATMAATVPNIERERPPTETLVPVIEMDTAFGLGFLPTEFVDISELMDIKIEAVGCHRTRLDWIKDSTGRDVRDELVTSARYRGLQCGTRYAEAFRHTPAAGRVRPERLLP